MQIQDGYGTRAAKIRTPNQGADAFKAKQSLGQNFLVDQNVARRICAALESPVPGGKNVIEVGPGKGALSAILLAEYPDMTAIEIDRRSVEYLAEQLPALKVKKMSVLDTDWSDFVEDAGGERLSVIGNLPYYITSQILFSIIDAAPHVRRAVITMQYEVAQRVVSTPRGKAYGILSVVTQLYGTPRLAFKIPPTVFQPQPDVDSALLVVDFPLEKPTLGVNECHLRTVLRASFQMRRKMLRQSLKRILNEKEITLPDEWGTLRPEALAPQQFVELTKLIFGPGETPAGISVWRGKLTDEARDPTASARQEGEDDSEY